MDFVAAGDFERPELPDEITANEARLAEVVLLQFVQSYVRHIPDVPALLNFVRSLCYFGSVEPDRAQHVVVQLISQRKAEATALEYFSLLVRCGYGLVSGKPSYRSLRNYGSISRAMFRHMMTIEERRHPTYLPFFKHVDDINTVLGLLLALQAFDTLGICDSKTVRYRRFYPLSGKNMFIRTGRGTTFEKALTRMQIQESRVTGEDWGSDNVTQAQGADGDYATEAEREYWRNRRNGY